MRKRSDSAASKGKDASFEAPTRRPAAQRLASLAPSAPPASATNWSKAKRAIGAHVDETKLATANAQGKTPSPWDRSFQRLMKARPTPAQASDAERFAAELAATFTRSKNGGETLKAKGRANGAGDGIRYHVNNAPKRSRTVPLQQLGGTLDRFRHLGHLPSSTVVLSELSSPVLDRPIDLEACNLALNLFRSICQHYRSASPDEELARWMWCCRAAELDNAQVRSRALGQLIELVAPPPASAPAPRPDTPLALQSFAAGLIRLLHATTKALDHGDESQRRDYQTVATLLSKASAGLIITPLRSEEYAVDGRPLYGEEMARVAYLEGLLRTTLVGPRPLAEFVLLRLLSPAWLPTQQLPESVLIRCVSQLARTIDRLLGNKTADEKDGVLFGRLYSSAMFNAVLELVDTHFPSAVLPTLPLPARVAIVEAYLPLLSGLTVAQYSNRHWPPATDLEVPNHAVEARGAIEGAMTVGSFDAVVQAAEGLLRSQDIEQCVAGVGLLMLGFDDKVSSRLATKLLPMVLELVSRLTDAKTETTIIELLLSLALRHPQTFYKPLFSCAASNKAEYVQSHLQTLRALARHLTPLRFYFRDAEMMAVALLSNHTTGEGVVTWTSARLGQRALVAELTSVLKSLQSTDMTVAEAREVRVFFDVFDARLERYWAQKEVSALISLEDRMLFCELLAGSQLVAASSRKPPWFDRIIRWSMATFVGAPLRLDPGAASNPFVDNTTPIDDELTAVAIAGASKSLRMLGKLVADEDITQSTSITQLSSAPLATSMLSLAAALYGGLEERDLMSLATVIWRSHLLASPKALFVPAAFLFMQAGERVAGYVHELILGDYESLNADVRYQAIIKLTNVFAGRFDILTQPLPDKLKRRPFRAGRQQIAFVPTNIGLSTHVPARLPIEANAQASLGASLPLEVRKALNDLGWDKDSSRQTASERERLPLHVLPISYAEKSQTQLDTSTSSPKPDAPLLRRKSSATIGPGASSRPVMVVAVAALIGKLTMLMGDIDAKVANAAREALLTCLRDDPVAIVRPLLEDLSASPDRQALAIRDLRRLLLINDQLPPAFLHHVLNHVAGFIKTVSRDGEQKDALAAMALVMPAIGALAPSIADMSVREIRKNKADVIFVPNGELWFTDSAPLAVGFPRSSPGDRSAFTRIDIPASLHAVSSMRIAQNHFLHHWLPDADTEAFWRVKQGLLPLALPGRDAPRPLTDSDFLPCITRPKGDAKRVSRRDQDVRAYSRLVARSHLQMTWSLLGGLSRHFSDRAELTRVFDGVTRALLEHGALHIDIVLLALRCCLLASIRFQRLFSSGGGFSVFISALYKTYCDTEVPAIRSAIEHAFLSFYSRHEHQESFVFQSLNVISSIIAKSNVDSAVGEIARDKLFALLRRMDEGRSVDEEDLLAATMEPAEREAMVSRFNDAPETVLAPLLKRDATEGTETRRLVANAGLKTRFSLEDAVRIHLTAITFEPASSRALAFLQLLSLLAPRFVNHGASTRALLRDGVEALAGVLVKSAPAAKVKPGVDTATAEANQALAWASARQAYLDLVVTYLMAGGELSPPAIRKTLDLLKALLRSAGPSVSGPASAVLHRFAETVYAAHLPPKALVSFLGDISSLFEAHIAVIDFAPFLDTLSKILADTRGTVDPAVSDAITRGFLVPAVRACVVDAGSRETLGAAMRGATVRLLAKLCSAGYAEAFASVERNEALSEALSGIVLPLISELTISDATTISVDPGEPTRQARFWLRLATYILKAASSGTTILAIHALKLLAIRGERDLSAGTGAWPFLAGTFRHVLAGASIDFLHAFPPSPPASRPASHDPFVGRHGRSASVDPPRTAMARPRAIDYAFWSLAELLVLHRSPLMIHLRPFIREKLVNARALTSTLTSSDNRSVSPIERSPTASPARPISSSPARILLARSNSQRSGTNSAPSSPGRRLSARPSPRGTATPRASFALYERAYRPVEPLSQPSSPTPAGAATASSFPKIQHLGLAASPALKSVRAEESHYVTSPALVKATIRRIRIVQILLGETAIAHPLALPAEGEDEDDALRAWTRPEALHRLHEETALLVTEL